jgi:hypothetical protein
VIFLVAPPSTTGISVASVTAASVGRADILVVILIYLGFQTLKYYLLCWLNNFIPTGCCFIPSEVFALNFRTSYR